MTVATVVAHRWTRREYDRLAAKGFLAPAKHVELIEGVIYDRPPENSLNATAIQLTHAALRGVFPLNAGYEIRDRLPLVVGEDSEPEPDFAVVRGGILDYIDAHPTTALLVMEIAENSLFHDLERKIPLYARSGIPEAWLLNLVNRELEIFRDPMEGVYQNRIILCAGDSVSPLACPEAVIAVSDLLP